MLSLFLARLFSEAVMQCPKYPEQSCLSALGERRVGVQLCRRSWKEPKTSAQVLYHSLYLQQKLSHLTGTKLGEMHSAVISAPR